MNQNVHFNLLGLFDVLGDHNGMITRDSHCEVVAKSSHVDTTFIAAPKRMYEGQTKTDFFTESLHLSTPSSTPISYLVQ